MPGALPFGRPPKREGGLQSCVLPPVSHLVLTLVWDEVFVCHVSSLDWKKNLVKEVDGSPQLETQRAGREVS